VRTQTIKPGPGRPGRRGAVVTGAMLVAVAILASGCSGGGKPSSPTGGVTSSSGSASSAASSPVKSVASTPAAKVVRVTSNLVDGDTVGVGEPIVLNFSPTPTNSTEFTKAVTITVDGQPATGAWYWEKPYADQPVQAHYRQQQNWPANAAIEVKLPIGGLSAGKGLVYAARLTSVSFRTGDSHVSTVDASTRTMTVTSNGKVVNTFPVSLGAATTPTYNGTKIVMQKGENLPGSDALRPNGTVMMSGPGYTGDPVPWSVRITASGEYVHAAGWNTNIGVRDTSNGCTNLKPADGKWFYNFSMLGDVVKYANTDGVKMNPLDGLGDWNIPWSLWSQGGLLLNH
jgi:lipoprotein-anchoring transpeptidase ErfK/SrfK